jgi:hypothetical protein
MMILFTLIEFFGLKVERIMQIYSKDKNSIRAGSSSTIKKLSPWKEGYFDIHHIHAGVNVASFLIFPDGTTMLIDCGDLDIVKFMEKYGHPTELYPKLDVIPPYPDNNGWLGH